MLSLELYPQPVQQVIGRVLQGEAVILRPEAGKVNVVNEVGARIWELADGSRSIRQIVEQICREYQVEQEQAQADAISFIQHLIDKKILTISQLPGSNFAGEA